MLLENGVPTELSDPLAFGIAQSILLSGSDIYVAGNTCQENQGPDCSVVTYWKNGTPVVLPDQNPSGAVSIFVSGGDVYVAGDYSTGPLMTHCRFMERRHAYSLSSTSIRCQCGCCLRERCLCCGRQYERFRTRSGRVFQRRHIYSSHRRHILRVRLRHDRRIPDSGCTRRPSPSVPTKALSPRSRFSDNQ